MNKTTEEWAQRLNEITESRRIWPSDLDNIIADARRNYVAIGDVKDAMNTAEGVSDRQLCYPHSFRALMKSRHPELFIETPDDQP